MKLKINNFIAIKSAEIELKPITFFAGNNNQGKSSCIRAIQHLLYENIDTSKKEAIKLVHNRQGNAEISIEQGENISRITYPDSTKTAIGAIKASPLSLGIHKLSSMTAKELSQFLYDNIDLKITEDDLKKALPNIDVKVIKKLYASIERDGVDNIHKQAKEAGAKLKGVWEQITETGYGSEKGLTWRPPEWDFKFESLESEVQLVEDLKTQETYLEVAISQSAVDAAEVSRLEKIVESASVVPAKRMQLESAQKRYLERTEELQKIVDLKPKSESVYKCPCCGESLILNYGTLEKVPQNNLTKQQLDEIETAQSELLKIKENLSLIAIQYEDLNKILRDTELANSQLVKILARKGDVSTDTINNCKADKERSEKRLNMFRTFQKAKKANQNIIDNVAIVNALSPSGLRQNKVLNSLQNVNSEMIKISELTKWKNVCIDNMQIFYGNIPYSLCSESEKYRVDIMLQLYFAKKLGDTIVIYDGADILSSDNRSSMFNMLLSFKEITHVVGMTYSKKEQAPNLDKYGGVTYWIEKGEICLKN